MRTAIDIGRWGGPSAGDVRPAVAVGGLGDDAAGADAVAWQVLVVACDPGFVADAMASLAGRTVFGQALSVAGASSLLQAQAWLAGASDVAVVIVALDDAAECVALARSVRRHGGLADTRIVLRDRDGEEASPLSDLLELDIDDRRLGQDLRGERLAAVVALAVRSRERLRSIGRLREQGQPRPLRDDLWRDPLVRLPNRAHFVGQVDERVRRGMREHILALLDIDDFSAANEVMGHRFGDCLLAEVAECLSRALPAGVVLARVGTDTFGVLGAIAQVDLRRLLDSVRQPLVVQGLPYQVSLTCGYVLLQGPGPGGRPADGGDTPAGADLVKDATIALKRAKRDHRGQSLQYLGEMGAEARARALLLSDLRSAIDDGLLFLAYQPQIDLRTGALVGLEALLRWRTREGRFVPPDQFIPVAEHSGLIVPLGRWVLRAACEAMRRLLDAGCAPQRMAINVSMVQLRDPGFFASVCAALAESGLGGRHIELEITESVAVLPTQLLESTLGALRAQGISLAIDDFGTGYSSLSSLERLPLDRIKIDRSFVRQLGDPHGARIAEMVAQLGRKLGLEVLAEGIEDATTLQVLRAIGCDQGQGYFIARPMDEAALMVWLRGHPGGWRVAEAV